jgi:hypothetical protein
LDIDQLNTKFLSEDDRDLIFMLFMDDLHTGPLWRNFPEQVIVLIDALRNRDEPVSWRIVGTVYNMSKGAICEHYRRARKLNGGKGGRPVLTASEKQWLQSLIAERFAAREPITYAQALNEIELQFGKCLYSSTLRKMVSRFPWCKTVHGVPKDGNRVYASEDAIDQYFNVLEQSLTGLPSAVIYNVDEVGCDQWVDKLRRSVIVPADYDKSSIDVPVMRNDSRATMIACIAADGRPLKPLIVLPRKTAETELYECGLTPDAVALLYQENGFANSRLFEWWVFNLFIPDTLLQRQKLGYAGLIFLILDGFAGHDSEPVQEAFLYYGIHPLVIPPHSSDQVQALDLGMFAIMKAESARIYAHIDFNAQTKKLVKMVSGWQKATTTVNIIKAFRRAGIIAVWNPEVNALVCRIDRAAASEVRHWNGEKHRIPIPIEREEVGIV